MKFWTRRRSHGYVLSLVALLPFIFLGAEGQGSQVPDARQVMRAVQDHQKQVEAMRENYTYTSVETTQEMDGSGKVTKTETEDLEVFFVNGHRIWRTVKKDGKALSAGDEQKETARVTKMVEKAQKIPSSQPLEGQAISVSRLLEIMDLRNPRREMYRGRATIIFDFVGRKDVKTHGIAEDASKKLQGTIWIDEADLQVVHLDVMFTDTFRVAGGLFASIDKGSNLHFDQAKVSNGLWLPTGADITMQARVLLLKNMRQHVTVQDSDYKTFHADAEQGADAKVTPAGKK